MKQISFYPGPSRVYSQIPEYILDAYSQGIMSVNHRGEAFMDLAINAKKILRTKLEIPEDYEIVFTTSATECWEIIAQSLTNNSSFHFFNGPFGEKWMTRAANITRVKGVYFDLNDELPVEKIGDGDVVCITQNETSNGTCVKLETVHQLRIKTDQLIAVDATSSMGGIYLDFTLADVWFASVQKCFGLPAGMGVMLLSPKAVQKAHQIGDGKRYNSLLTILDNWNKNQAPYTPNVLALYLLYRTQERAKPIREIHQKLITRHVNWVSFLDGFSDFDLMAQNEKIRSPTVLAVKCANPGRILEKAEEFEIVFGKGYGQWKDTTFRIANFPAIKRSEIDKAHKFLQKFC